jgi:hypothetical protein
MCPNLSGEKEENPCRELLQGFSCTLNYTYSRTALYQELDELCRLVDKFKHRGLLFPDVS